MGSHGIACKRRFPDLRLWMLPYKNAQPTEFQVKWTVLGNLEIQKTDAQTGEAEAQGNGSLQGAVYTVSKDGQEIGKIETDEKGYGRLENLAAGTYTVKETKAPAG